MSMNNGRRDYRSEVKAGPPNRRTQFLTKIIMLGSILLVIAGVLAGIGVFIWYGCRIETANV
ncbi:MAG: hypothetical protein FWG74_08520 [Planctomycetes bacterium]|nr:hypothetical protein [Planctomycetota bacterium]